MMLTCILKYTKNYKEFIAKSHLTLAEKSLYNVNSTQR